MLANNMIQNNNNEDPATIATHRCLGCLTGADPRKRDCAIRRLLAEGFAMDPIRTATTSSKSVH